MNAPTAVSHRRRKRMRAQARSTPWKDSYELDAVGRSLLLAARLQSPQGTMTTALLNETQQQDLANALCRVNIWKARSDQGRIPHSIETTFALAQVAWRDATSDATLLSIELRMAYSSAILRGVNGLADVLQQNRAYAASVASLCEQLGLPGWLVDVRHESAHNDLPSLSVLRLACKTFLGYLEERYWIPLETSRFEARETAAGLLVKYKETCKKSVSAEADAGVGANEGSSSESSSSDESELGNNTSDSQWGKNLGTNQNRFAAFLDTSERAKPTKKRKKEAQTNDENKAQDAVHSALHFARAFIRDTPIDVGYQVALSFLVWGGIGDAPSGRGVMIPGSLVSFPASDEGIQRIRQRYKPLILALCKAWPGFASALLVHLVDHVLSIESSLVENEVDAGSERKLYFLSSWIRFLLSREFQMHNDSSVALFGKQDLAKKSPLKWSKTERDFMESPAPSSILAQAHLPLNSLCDRCAGTDKFGLAHGSHALGVMLNDILGDHRVVNHGLAIDKGDDDSRPRRSKTTESVGSKSAATLSLDEMETMLNRDTKKEVAETTSKTISRTEDNEPKMTSTTVMKKSNVWSQRPNWETCAIGSLPGRIS